MPNQYVPKKEDRFTFGLWTVGNRGGDAFGAPVRPAITPSRMVERLSELGAYGVNLHDDDLFSPEATASEQNRAISELKGALAQHDMKVPMVSPALGYHAVFRDGAFTSSSAQVRAFSLKKAINCLDLAADLGADVFVLFIGREGSETDAGRTASEALKWYRESINFLCGYSLEQKLKIKFALEAKPNENRGDAYLPTTGHTLAFISTLDHSDLVGVNPEFAHEQMSGLNFYHEVAQAIDAGKLFHIDLNDQRPSRYRQDFRFGSESFKTMFFLVKLLEETGYRGPKHFDCHPYRSEDEEGVWQFALACMRNYKILQQKVEAFNSDKKIQAIISQVKGGNGQSMLPEYNRDQAAKLKVSNFDHGSNGGAGASHEALDQLLVELLLGV